MIIAMTGHRPEKIPNQGWVQTQLGDTFRELKPSKVIQGMASGVDLWSAREAFLLGIPFVAARPWAGHKPRKIDTYAYGMAMKHAEEIVNVDDAEDYPGVWVYDNRNKWMVDRADLVVAVWNGDKKGGTYNCVKYAQKIGKEIYRIDPVTERVGPYASAIQ